MKLFLFLVTFCALMFSGCPNDNCEVASTRCEGNVAQVCNADKNWQDFLSCDEMEGDWVCGQVPETKDFTCLQEEGSD